MVRTPQSLKQAKQIIHEERVKISSSLSAIAGSRWLMAILATFALAFGAHLAYAPSRLPPVAGLSAAHFGLPSGIDFGFVGEQAKDAARAAQEQDARGRAVELINEHPERIPLINAVGFGLALVLLLVNMTIMTRRRRVTRG